jgi:hypothetical protein
MIACSCSAIDSLDSNPSVSYTVNPSTSNAGTLTTTCTATDNTGNSATSSISYTVNSPGGGYPNYRILSEDLSKGYTKVMRKNWKMNFKIENETHSLLIDSVNTNSISITLSSTPENAILNVGDEKKFEVTEDNYYDLLIKLNSIENSLVNLTIQSIHEKVFEEVLEEKIKEKEEGEIVEKKSYWGIWIILIIMLLVIIAVNQKRLKKYFKKKKSTKKYKGY